MKIQKISLTIIATMILSLNGCVNTSSGTPEKTDNLFYIGNTKGKSLSQVSIIANEGRKITIASINDETTPSRGGLFTSIKDIVVSPGLVRIAIRYRQYKSYADSVVMASLKKGKTYILNYIINGDRISYYLKDKDTNKRTKLLFIP